MKKTTLAENTERRRYVEALLDLKIKGTDCTEFQSAEIKGFIRDTYQTKTEKEMELNDRICEHFPLEWSEAIGDLEEMGITIRPRKFIPTTVSESKHTPTPWVLGHDPSGEDGLVTIFERAKANVICVVGDPDNFDPILTDANAQRIVTAVNCFDEMVDILERCKDYLHTKYPKEAEIFNHIETVIQKAER